MDKRTGWPHTHTHTHTHTHIYIYIKQVDIFVKVAISDRTMDCTRRFGNLTTATSGH
jgi:hypothetical protein